MQDMIRKMLDVEAQARRIVEEAEAEARKAVKEATEAASLRRNQAIEQARNEARRLMAEAEAEAQDEKNQVLQARRGQLESSIKVSTEAIDAAARKVAAVVSGLPESHLAE